MSLPFKPTVAWSKLYSSADAKGICFLYSFLLQRGNLIVSVLFCLS